MADWRDDPRSVVFEDVPASLTPTADGLLSITNMRERFAAHIRPEYAGEPARLKVMDVPGHDAPFTAADVMVHADGSVTCCECHVPVVEGDLILGLRPAV